MGVLYMLALATFATAQASAQTAIVPSESWQVGPSPGGCIATQSQEASGIVVAIEHLGGSNPVLGIAAPEALLPDGQGMTTIGVGPSGEKLAVRRITQPGAEGQRVIKLFVDQGSWGVLLKATEWRIGKVRLAVKNAGSAIEALTSCTSDRLRSWGVDPKLFVENKMARFGSDVTRYLGSDHYPKKALKKRIEGSVTLLLLTAADGSVTECKIVNSTDSSLDEGSCAAARRMRMIPPTDDNGRSMSSYVIMPMAWSLPR